MTFKPVPKRRIVAALRHHHCVKVSEQGIHEKWRCESGEHTTSVPRHHQISAGVVKNIIEDMKCLPKGWLK